MQKLAVERGDKRPVYCLFIAESLVETVFGHFLTQARFKNQWAHGPLKIVPVRRQVFEKLVEGSLKHKGFSQDVLRTLLEFFFSPSALQLGELDWGRLIDARIEEFFTASCE